MCMLRYIYIYMSQRSAVKAECVFLKPSRDPTGGKSDLNAGITRRKAQHRPVRRQFGKCQLGLGVRPWEACSTSNFPRSRC